MVTKEYIEQKKPTHPCLKGRIDLPVLVLRALVNMLTRTVFKSSIQTFVQDCNFSNGIV